MLDAAKWQRYQVMKTMGWTFSEYQRTPARIVEEVWLMIQTEAKATGDKMKEVNGN